MSDATGVIKSGEAYTVAEFRRRAGIGDYAFRKVRQSLRIIEIGKKRYVLGADWLEYLRQAAQKNTSPGDDSR